MWRTVLITVIVPIYNVEDYLPKCIDSILCQTYSDLEIILIDDGSHDNSPKICDSYAKKDKRIHVIHKANGGLSDARNAGLDIAKGEYISFVDSDDYIEPKMYEKMYTFMEDKQADICICGYHEVDENGSVLKSIKQPDQTVSREDIFHVLMQENVFYAIMCNKLFARHVFENNGHRFPVGKIHEDEFLIHHLYGECQTVSVLNECYYNYVARKGSIMHSQRYSLREYDDVEVYLDRAVFFHQNGYLDYSARLLHRTADDCVRVYNLTEHTAESKLRVKEIRDSFHEQLIHADLRSLKTIRKIELKLFDKNFVLYCFFNRIVKAIEVIKN